MAMASAACYAFDIRAVTHFYSGFEFGRRCDHHAFENKPFHAVFVKRVFPAVFWGASPTWSDPRLAGWFWFLGIPPTIYAPLARLARQYDAPEPFKAAAGVIIE
jgi:hypothetical protein